jgi:alpha-L-fucosidase
MYSAGVELKTNQKVNCIVLKEQLNNGQHCAQFKLLLFNKADQLVKEIAGTTIGSKRILTFPAVDINTIELTILQQDGVTAVSEIEAYLIDETLIEKK